jgi:hypothetical protein
MLKSSKWSFTLPKPLYRFYMITLLYLVCPDVLSTVGDSSYGTGVGFIESDILFNICIYLFVSEVQSPLLSS